MEDFPQRLAALEAALNRQTLATDRELVAMKHRLGATWGCAFAGIVGAFVLGLSPDARAQFGVTLSNLNNRLTAVESKTQFVSVRDGEMFVTGTNLHVRSGSGTTDGAANGRGNLIVGYNEEREAGNDRSGSHNLVVGIFHGYSSYGGVVVGRNNRILAPFASVTGGDGNTSIGNGSSVSGGKFNTASGDNASVSGGSSNIAGGTSGSVSGGGGNTTNNEFASVSGGRNNNAAGFASSVSGGRGRSIIGSDDWVAGDLFQDD